MQAHDKHPRPVIEVLPDTHERLQRLSREQHRPMGEIVTDLLDRYEREQFWDEVNASVDRLRADPVAWKDYRDEVEFLQRGSDVVVDEPYFTPEEEEEIRAAARAEGR